MCPGSMELRPFTQASNFSLGMFLSLATSPAAFVARRPQHWRREDYFQLLRVGYLARRASGRVARDLQPADWSQLSLACPGKPSRDWAKPAWPLQKVHLGRDESTVGCRAARAGSTVSPPGN